MSPSHPKLLDWLAVEFMQPAMLAPGEKALPSAWNVKHIHRLIVNSATYRESSRVTPELYTRDQYNRLLARGPRFRVDAEIVRDIALTAAGLLNENIGGPGVTPPAPAFLFQPPVSYGRKFGTMKPAEPLSPRDLYVPLSLGPLPCTANFRRANGDFSCVRRLRSNTPLQALASLNEVIFMECAQALATHSLETIRPPKANESLMRSVAVLVASHGRRVKGIACVAATRAHAHRRRMGGYSRAHHRQERTD